MLRKALITAAAVFLTVDAIYEDQVDDFDWLKTNIGHVSQAVYAPVSPKSVYCATHQKAIAKLSTKDGVLKWRQLIPEDTLDAIVLTKHGLASISGYGKYVRMWDTTDGSLLWDTTTFSGDSESPTVSVLKINDDRIAVASDNGVTMVDVANGKQRWRWESTAESFSTAQLIATKENLVFIGVSKAGDSTAFVLSTALGEIESEKKLPTVENPAVSVLTEDGKIVFVSVPKEGTSISIFEISTGHVKTVDAKAYLPSGETLQGVIGLSDVIFALQTSSGSRNALRISTKMEIQAIGSPTDVHGVSKMKDQHFVGAVRSKGPISMSVLDAVSGEAVLESKSHEELYSQHGKIEQVIPIVYEKKKSEQLTFRMMMVMEDHALVMFNDNDMLWTREEGLGAIESAEWVTPTDSRERDAISKIPNFTECLFIQMNELVDFVQTFSFKALLLGSSHAEKSHFFGFSKLIIVLSKAGKLYALQSETGDVVWSRRLEHKYRLIVTRDEPGLGAGPEVLLLSQDLKAKTHAIWIDAETGENIEEQMFDAKYERVFMLPHHKHHMNQGESVAVTRRAVALCDQDMNIIVTPETEDTINDMKAALQHLYFYSIDEDDSVHGYKVIQGDPYRAVETWSVVFPQGERIVSTSQLAKHDIVHSAVSITGDDSLLLKYLNPHMFAVATATQVESDDGELIPSMVLNLIDSVSGRIIHRISHQHGQAPFHVTQSENSVYYSFWNAKMQRTEFGSLSLFDGAINAYGLNLWKRPLWIPTRSSFSSKLPIVLQKSFIFPGFIKTMSPTMTAQGITPKHILVAMGTGQIYSLPKKLIDPRRPELKPTAQQQSEKLLQYFPHLPVYNNPLSMVSYNKTIANVHTITTAPARLESTSLALAYGLDLFYVRVAPADTFDLLPEDFNFELLILLVVGLCAATLVLRKIVRRKALYAAWK